LPARDRAEDAADRIRKLLGDGGPGTVSVQDVPQGSALMLDGRLVLVVTSEDASTLPDETARTLADQAAEALRRVVVETREARDHRYFMRAALHAGIATAIWLVLMWLAHWLWRVTAQRLMWIADR